MSDLVPKLEERMAEIKKKFDALNAEFQELGKKRSDLDRRMAEIQREADRLDSAYGELKKFADESKPDAETIH